MTMIVLSPALRLSEVNVWISGVLVLLFVFFAGIVGEEAGPQENLQAMLRTAQLAALWIAASSLGSAR